MGLLVGLVLIGGLLWWSGTWPFDGSYNLPQRDRGPHHKSGPSSSSGNPPV